VFPSISIVREIDELRKGRGFTQSSPQSYEDSKSLYRKFVTRTQRASTFPLARLIDDEYANKGDTSGYFDVGWIFIIAIVFIIASVLPGTH